MNEMELLSRWRAEIGRQLLDGAIHVRLKDIAEATRAQVESPIQALSLWKGLWRELEDEGLVRLVHHSDEESGLVDLFKLTDEGSDPAAWHK